MLQPDPGLSGTARQRVTSPGGWKKRLGSALAQLGWIWRDAGTPPQRNSTVLVQKLLAAGGVVMGKTRMHELAYGVTSISPAFGPVSNPYDVTKIPGGEPCTRAQAVSGHRAGGCPGQR